MKTFEDLGFTRENMGDNFSPRMIRYTHKSYKDNGEINIWFMLSNYKIDISTTTFFMIDVDLIEAINAECLRLKWFKPEGRHVACQ